MLDAYYGYDDHGLVRTNLAGGVDRKKLAAERGAKAVQGARSRRCVDRCRRHVGQEERTSTSATTCASSARCTAHEILGNIRDFLDQNLTDVVVIDIEDYVKPAGLQAGADRREPLRPGVAAEAQEGRVADAPRTWSCRRTARTSRTHGASS